MSEIDELAAADARRSLSLDLSDEAYQMWRHNPVTAAYLQYLEDYLAYLRVAGADLLETGSFDMGERHEDKNPQCLRGQIITLRRLHGLSLSHIQSFYGKEPPAEDSQDDQE